MDILDILRPVHVHMQDTDHQLDDLPCGAGLPMPQRATLRILAMIHLTPTRMLLILTHLTQTLMPPQQSTQQRTHMQIHTAHRPDTVQAREWATQRPALCPAIPVIPAMELNRIMIRNMALRSLP